jgi:hypothetical protein
LFQVAAYGVMLNISRQMIINDQLNAINRMLGSAGQRVADWENAKAYALLVSAAGAGPTLLTDTTAVAITVDAIRPWPRLDDETGDDRRAQGQLHADDAAVRPGQADPGPADFCDPVPGADDFGDPRRLPKT